MTLAIITIEPLAIVQTFNVERLDPVFWPDGSMTHGTSPGYRNRNNMLVAVQYDEAPNEFYQIGLQATPARLDGATLNVSRNWQPFNLDDTKVTLVARLNEVAERMRQQHITPGAAQAMVYLEKRMEAKQYIADPQPDPADYPLLVASIGDQGETIADVASYVLKVSVRWTAAAARIEATRFAGKRAIMAAADVNAAVAACRSVVWS